MPRALESLVFGAFRLIHACPFVQAEARVDIDAIARTHEPKTKVIGLADEIVFSVREIGRERNRHGWCFRCRVGWDDAVSGDVERVFVSVILFWAFIGSEAIAPGSKLSPSFANGNVVDLKDPIVSSQDPLD